MNTEITVFDTDSSDEETISYLLSTDMIPGMFEKEKNHRGSTLGRRYIHRDFDEGVQRLYRDYFGNNAGYSDTIFERRFRMSRKRALNIYRTLHGKELFVRRTDATGREVIHPLQSCC